MQTFGWCSVADVLEAFRIVSHEIRNKLKRLEAAEAPSQGEACQVALRLRDQRELIRQLLTRRRFRHARRLMRINRRLRQRLLRRVQSAGLNSDVLIFK